MGKFHQILMVICPLIFMFPGGKLCTGQGILTKLGTCIDIKEIWLGIVNGQTLLMFDRVICPRHDSGGVS